MRRPKLSADVQQSERTLPLDVSLNGVKNTVVLHVASARSDNELDRPIDRVQSIQVRPDHSGELLSLLPRHVSGHASDTDRDVSIVSRVQPGHVPPDPHRVAKQRLSFQFDSLDGGLRGVRERDDLRPDGGLHLKVRVVRVERRDIQPGSAASDICLDPALIAPGELRRESEPGLG